MDLSAHPPHAGKLAQLSGTVSSLRLDAAASEAIHHLELAGVPALLLKGRSFARWLYPQSAERSYRDCDLLVPAARLEIAADMLTEIHYEPVLDERAMPSWWREHAGTWFRRRDGITIDLHRTLPGVTANDEDVWQLLWANSEVMPIGGSRIGVLSLPARAMHVALHAAQHGAGWDWPIADLQRALAVGDDRAWERAAQLASELGAIDAFVAGLHLVPAGTALAERLALPVTWSVEAELRASSAPPTALTVERLVGAGRFDRRVAIAWRKLVPPPEFMRSWDPRATESRSALFRAYLRRPLWLLGVTPGSVRAWRRARKSVRSSRGKTTSTTGG